MIETVREGEVEKFVIHVKVNVVIDIARRHPHCMTCKLVGKIRLPAPKHPLNQLYFRGNLLACDLQDVDRAWTMKGIVWYWFRIINL